MKDSFLLALRALVRGRMFPLLLAGVALVHWLLPAIVRSDGSATGALEMFIRAVPGSSAVMVMLVLLVAACGMLAREREERRLALAVVRPVSAAAVVAGRWLALVFVAALALAFSAALTLAFPQAATVAAYPACRHHYAPALPLPATVAAHLLDDYLKDPKTPEAVKKASKRAVLTLLATKEIDRYDVIPPGETMVWPYGIDGLEKKMALGERLSLRVRFSTQFELRSPVAGEIALGGYSAVVSNNTQSLIEIPLEKAKPVGNGATAGKGVGEDGRAVLAFTNTGKSAVMVRPRRDLEVLAPADSFAMNLLRAEFEVWAMAALLAALGLFLSAALSRPVAVFTALVAYAIVLMAPSVIAQFPDEFNAPWSDRLGLALSRGIQSVTAGLAEPTPVADLATSRAVEWPAMIKVGLMDVILLPAALVALAAFIIRRKPQD